MDLDQRIFVQDLVLKIFYMYRDEYISPLPAVLDLVMALASDSCRMNLSEVSSRSEITTCAEAALSNARLKVHGLKS